MVAIIPAQHVSGQLDGHIVLGLLVLQRASRLVEIRGDRHWGHVPTIGTVHLRRAEAPAIGGCIIHKFLNFQITS